MSDTTAGQKFEPVGTVFVLRVFYCFCAVAFLSFAISLAGRYYGRSIALGGHSDSIANHEIVIGNNVIAAPENMIRLPNQRHGGVHARLDLYAKWPEMTGYDDNSRAIFNDTTGKAPLLFLSFEEQAMSRDMSGRFEPIYSQLIERPGKDGPAGLSVYHFKPHVGYGDERLVTGQRANGSLFVARCPGTDDTITSCERDIIIGDNLILTYRFPASLIGQWRAIDASVMAKTHKLLKTGN